MDLTPVIHIYQGDEIRIIVVLLEATRVEPGSGGCGSGRRCLHASGPLVGGTGEDAGEQLNE